MNITRRAKITTLLLATAWLLQGYANAMHVEPVGQPKQTNLYQLSQQRSQRNIRALERRVKSIHAENVPAYAVYLALAEKAGLHVKMELLSPQEKDKLISLSIADGRTVYEVIDQILFSDNRYTTYSGVLYIPREYRPKPAREVGDTSPEPVRPPYIFTTEIEEFKAVRQSPDQAIRAAVGLEQVRNKPPGLPVEVSMSGKAASIPEMSFTLKERPLRSIIGLIATATDKNSIARIVKKPNGQRVIEVKLFDTAAEVCPEAAKVQVEMEDAQQ